MTIPYLLPEINESGEKTSDEIKRNPLDVKLPDVLSVKEVARFLRVNVKTVYQAVSKEELPARKIGRRIVIHRDTLLQWVSSGSVVIGQGG